MKNVFIVDTAIVSALGVGMEANWLRLAAGRSAVQSIDRFDVSRLPFRLAACVRSLAGPNRICALTASAFDQLATVPDDTAIIWTGIKPDVDFIESGQNRELPFVTAHYRAWVSRHLGRHSPVGLEVNAACASFTVGLALAARMITAGTAGSVLVCGTDIVSHFVHTGFAALKALCTEACRPFDRQRNGLCLGDGAAAILLTDGGTAAAAGLSPMARLSGWHITNDANHITGPSRDGAGLAEAMAGAATMAGIRFDAIQAFCAHGTGTVFNDGMELKAMASVFGDRRFPVFSIKGAVGHCLGAAGGIEAAVSVRCLAEQTIPPTAGLTDPEPAALGRVADACQPTPGGNILTSNSGFGGINAALILEAV